MSGSIDDEIVRMRFDAGGFERGVASAIGVLSKLKSSLSFGNAGKSLDTIEAKANKFNLSGMASGVDAISHKFSALSVAGITAIANIANRAVNAGLQMAKSLTIAPIMDGFHEYETQLNSVQTILANTGLKGASGMAQVNGALNELNTYSDKTIYNFSEMAKNIGTFTAAGVSLPKSTAAIKGIANVAALSGSNSEQASTAMYQLSQAIANNKVGLQDWNSVVNAGMGGKVLQQALFNTAKLKGTLKGVDANTTFDQWTKSGNSFRDSLKSGWLTGDVLTQTLSQFTGDMTDAQLKSMGYNAQQIKSIQEQAKTAQDAATKVKTFTQLMGTLKEAVGSGWSQSFQLIFGNFDEAKNLWTGVSQSIGGLISNSAKARNKVLSDWKALGGRTVLIDAIKMAFQALGAVVKPIKQAFRDIFPAQTGKSLYELTKQFHVFVENLKIGPETADRIHRAFRGVFALFDIGKQIIGGIIGVFKGLFSAIPAGSGGVLDFAAKIGDMIVAFDEALKSGAILSNFFKIVGNIMAVPIRIAHLLAAALGQLFSGFKPKDALSATSGLQTVSDVLQRGADLTSKFGDFFSKLQGKIVPAAKKIGEVFSKIGAAIANAFNSQTFANVLQTLQVGLLGGIMLTLKKFLSGGLGGFHVDVGKGLFGQVKDTLGGVTDSLKAMQTELKAKALMEIAIALGVLAASIVVLAYTDPKKVENALKQIAIGFGELLAAMAILSKISGSAGFVKLPLIAASLDMLAVAILLLSVSVYALSKLSWQELQKGLTAVGALLAGLAATSFLLSKSSANMISAGIGITAMAVGINLLYFAVKNFSSMSWDKMFKGLEGVGIALGGIAVVMRLMPKGMVLQAVAIGILAGALLVLYRAVSSFATLSYGSMLKGLTGIAGALGVIAAAMHLMPKGMVLQAAALVILAKALQGIDQAVAAMAKLSWNDLLHGLVGLAGALGILAGALYLMTGTIGGAVALIIVSKALSIFIPVIQSLGKMSWGDLLHGLVGLGAAFAVVGIAGLLLTPVIPALLGLGVALGLLGIAMVAFGGGAALLGIGLTAIAASGGAAVAVLIGAVRSLLLLLPVAAKSIATAFVTFISIIGKNAPTIIGAFVTMVNTLLQAIPKMMPNLITALNSIITTFLSVLTTNAPKIIQAGLTLLLDLLEGISNNIVKITRTVADIIVKFLNELASQMPRIVAAGVRLLFKFLEGIASAAGKLPGEAVRLIGIFVGALFGSFGKIFSAGVSALGKLLSGIGNGIGNMFSKGVEVIGKFLSGLVKGAAHLAEMGANFIGDLIGGIGGAVAGLGEQALSIGRSLVSGILNGLGGLVDALYNKLRDMFGDVIDAIGDFLGIGGPSKTFRDMIGVHIPDGIAAGVDKNKSNVVKSIQGLGETSVVAMKKTMAGLGKAISDTSLDYNPTITPVLDLGQFQQDASRMGGLIGVTPVTASLSYAQASSISATRSAESTAAASQTVGEQVPLVKIEQNNYSPKALSTLDIYRQTNNAISKVKSALGK